MVASLRTYTQNYISDESTPIKNMECELNAIKLETTLIIRTHIPLLLSIKKIQYGFEITIMV